MDDTPKKPGFTIPESFLNQLEEYTRGYMLVVCNERGELFVHEAYDNPVIKLGLVNFADMHVSASQQHMHNMALMAEEDGDLDDNQGTDENIRLDD
jgi:hypothetical protein